MNYQQNKNFVKYYNNNVLLDLLPMMTYLFKESIVETKYYPYTVEYMNRETGIIKTETHIKIVDEKRQKYTDNEIKRIFFDHVNINEFEMFCEILRIDYNYIVVCFKHINIFEFEHFNYLLGKKYEQYFRDEKRSECNLKRKLKNIKYIK